MALFLLRIVGFKYELQGKVYFQLKFRNCLKNKSQIQRCLLHYTTCWLSIGVLIYSTGRKWDTGLSWVFVLCCSISMCFMGLRYLQVWDSKIRLILSNLIPSTPKLVKKSWCSWTQYTLILKRRNVMVIHINFFLPDNHNNQIIRHLRLLAMDGGRDTQCFHLNWS